MQQPISQTEINSKVSRTLNQAELSRLVGLAAKFHRAVDLQNRRDAETIKSLTRMLRNPRGAQAVEFVELVRGIIAQELDSKGKPNVGN
jgi:hypothetical protein